MENPTNHFADSVPQELRNKLLELADYVKDEFISDFSPGMGKDAYGCADITAVHGYAISGFIPSQNGGYEVTELYSNGWSCGSYFTSGESLAEEEGYSYMLECFARDVLDLEDDAVKEWAKEFEYDSLTAEQQDALTEYESDWFEPVLLRFEVWIARESEWIAKGESKAIKINLSCNYNDAPYYRSNKDELMHDLELSIEEFMQLEPSEVIEKLTAPKWVEDETAL